MTLLEKPFLVSYTGVQAGCEPPCRPVRNLADEGIEGIAPIVGRGGLIGIGVWPEVVGGGVWRIADAMRHVMDSAACSGCEPGRHVALGSDHDGAVTPFFDVSRLGVLTAILRRGQGPGTEKVEAGHQAQVHDRHAEQRHGVDHGQAFAPRRAYRRLRSAAGAWSRQRP